MPYELLIVSSAAVTGKWNFPKAMLYPSYPREGLCHDDVKFWLKETAVYFSFSGNPHKVPFVKWKNNWEEKFSQSIITKAQYSFKMIYTLYIGLAQLMYPVIRH